MSRPTGQPTARLMRWVIGSLALASAAVPAAPGAAGELLFVSNRGGNAQIHRLSADGGIDLALTRTAQENTEPAWSPDGRQVAFTSYRDGNAEVYVMNADGSGQRRLTEHPAADSAPAWLPDGRIVFRSVRERWANFYAIAADGSGLTALTDTAHDKGPPVVSPDGRWIAYVMHGERGLAELMLLPSTGGAARDLTSALSKNPKSAPAWSPDSRRLAYVEAKDLGVNIGWVDIDGQGAAMLTRNAFTNAYPAWSPDGRRIAFVSSRDGGRTDMARGDIYVMAADGSAPVNLTRHPEDDSQPSWSADGQTLVFASLRDGRSQLYAVPAAGGPARRLTRSEGFDLMARPYVPAQAPH